MALRIDKAVVRGEIDNTKRGVVRGKLWLVGRDEPVELDLRGNAWRDVAGRTITFSNPRPEDQSLASHLQEKQRGSAGDITASRKVKVFTVPEEEWQAAYRERRIKDVPTEWRNSIYLEWFSDFNGRVVIESADFKISASEGTWDLDEAEEESQKRENMETMRSWLADIIQRPEPSEDDDDGGFDDSEEAWEESLKQSDRLGEAHEEALEKFGHEAIGGDEVAYVMGWDHLLERDKESDAADRESEDGESWKKGSEGVEDEEDDGWYGDDENEESIRRRHPLQLRASDLVLRILKEFDDEPAADRSSDELDSALDRFIHNTMNISGKLAGALHGRDLEDLRNTGFTLALLRRCLNWSNEALAALGELIESPEWKKRSEFFGECRTELFAIRDGITDLRKELREIRD